MTARPPAVYSLEEAADLLQWPPSVLFRLCRAFRQPAAVFREPMLFEPSPRTMLFEAPDLRFFQDVRERLAQGGSLEAMIAAATASSVPETPTASPSLRERMQRRYEQQRPAPSANPYRQLAERTFNRYKGLNVQQKPSLFHSLLKRLDGDAAPDAPPPPKAGPGFPVFRVGGFPGGSPAGIGTPRP